MQHNAPIMLTVNKLLPQGRGLARVLLNRATTVELDWDVRQKSRFDATDSGGRHLGVFLPRGTLVRGGDVLVAEDGSMIKVIAAAQPVLEVRICSAHGTPFDLLRAAYHLGNRHVQLELQPDHLKLEPDHVLADMLRQMHLIVARRGPPSSPRVAPMRPAATATRMNMRTTIRTIMVMVMVMVTATRTHRHPRRAPRPAAARSASRCVPRPRRMCTAPAAATTTEP